MSEPVLSWNLFLTAILVPTSIFILGIWINRLFKSKDAKDERINRLREEIDKKKEMELQSWRADYSQTICYIKQGIQKIQDDMNNRVSRDDCHRSQDDVWAAIDHLRDEVHRTPFNGQ